MYFFFIYLLSCKVDDKCQLRYSFGGGTFNMVLPKVEKDEKMAGFILHYSSISKQRKVKFKKL